FRTFDEKWEEPVHGEYYCVIDLGLARAPQTLLAYDMNGQPLPTAFGAPLRLRLENQLGYKMVKWVRSMELIAEYGDIGDGYGGGGGRFVVLMYLPPVLLWSEYSP